mmetsp:Transcript_610/g.2402  ORF Transcript_610/g.2402 Transcript_610/m.2402 type:complete len:347 (-) Transcript_610:98-1138(-)|eukprot:CAMPEP_0185691762 /NCGR_PEP_ID=MMETSP1164-20130828/2051_1 /TAXON_ID=1104430 /ORGANISM="Chrysoreinhardia sp, Strain CCMP2950" /LENGTH=346 /DNA_ID=CAMNT_0028358447 /DNA_START=15 /DNA_END=1055 /DNA_ORIENTATION=-
MASSSSSSTRNASPRPQLRTIRVVTGTGEPTEVAWFVPGSSGAAIETACAVAVGLAADTRIRAVEVARRGAAKETHTKSLTRPRADRIFNIVPPPQATGCVVALTEWLPEGLELRVEPVGLVALSAAGDAVVGRGRDGLFPKAVVTRDDDDDHHSTAPSAAAAWANKDDDDDFSDPSRPLLAASSGGHRPTTYGDAAAARTTAHPPAKKGDAGGDAGGFRAQLLKFERINAHLANERTYLAWVRTALALVSVGLTLLGEATGNAYAWWRVTYFVVGALFLVCVDLTWLTGWCRYRRTKELLALPKRALPRKFGRYGVRCQAHFLGVLLAATLLVFVGSGWQDVVLR